MRFEAHVAGSEIFETMIRVNTSTMNRSGRADDVNDIVNIFIHENDHGQFLKEIGAARYLDNTTSKSKIQAVETRAIKAQMNHPTWDKGISGLREGISDYANTLNVLIPGLNAPTMKNVPISAPLKIKKLK